MVTTVNLRSQLFFCKSISIVSFNTEGIAMAYWTQQPSLNIAFRALSAYLNANWWSEQGKYLLVFSSKSWLLHGAWSMDDRKFCSQETLSIHNILQKIKLHPSFTMIQIVHLLWNLKECIYIYIYIYIYIHTNTYTHIFSCILDGKIVCTSMTYVFFNVSARFLKINWEVTIFP